MLCLCCEGGGGGSVGGAVMDAGSYKDFTTQYAKSGKSTCRGCENKIDKVCHQAVLTFTFTFTFTFGEDSMLSSAEAVIRFGPMRNPEITERLCKSL